MLSSATAEVFIKFSIEVEQYIDPEAGKYTNPGSPGAYEFDIKDEIEIEVPFVLGVSKTDYVNEIVCEIIKQVTGMSAYEVWKNLARCSGWIEYDETHYGQIMFDSDGNVGSSFFSDCAIMVEGGSWSPNYTSQILWYTLAFQYGDKFQLSWSQPVLDAIEKGTVFRYKYIFEYKGKDKIGTYSFVFNIVAQIKKKETTL